MSETTRPCWSSRADVLERFAEEGDWLANIPLSELRLSDEGILVLGIRPSRGALHGAPRGDDAIYSVDNLDDFANLDQRRVGRVGDREHRKAFEEREAYEEANPIQRIGRRNHGIFVIGRPLSSLGEFLNLMAASKRTRREMILYKILQAAV